MRGKRGNTPIGVKGSTIIRKVERLGVSFVLQGRAVGLVWPELDARQYQEAWQLERDARKHAYLVEAIIRDREASHRWEASGHDPEWWKPVKPVISEVKDESEPVTVGMDNVGLPYDEWMKREVVKQMGPGLLHGPKKKASPGRRILLPAPTA